MYLKLFILFLGVFPLTLKAVDEIDELFGDSLEIETESFDDLGSIEEMKSLFGTHKKGKIISRGDHKGDWEIDDTEVDIDKISFKEQSKSLIEWDKIEAKTWFDFNMWRLNRMAKDNSPDWKMNLRDLQYHELVGKMIRCTGDCKLFRGNKYVNSHYLSLLREGDEIVLEKDSYAWIYLMDGSLLRLSPHTSMSFSEINFTKEKSFKYLRLNYGSFQLRPWLEGEFEQNQMSETDLVSLPIMTKEANREFYARLDYKAKDDLERIQEELKPYAGRSLQISELNKMLSENQRVIKDQVSFIVTPVTTIESYNQQIDVFYQLKGSASIRVKDNKEGFKKIDGIKQEAVAFYRGYDNTTSFPLRSDQWFEMVKDGKGIIENPSFQEKYNYIDMLTNRVYTFELARTLFAKKNSNFIFNKELNYKKFAEKDGFRLWTEEELSKRQSFLKEYTRRVETTNLSSLEKVQSLEGTLEFGKSHYEKALVVYTDGLKNLYHQKNIEIKKFNDVEYYVWLLQNAK